MKQKNNKIDYILDKVYANRRLLLLYFVSAFVCTIVRYFAQELLLASQSLSDHESALIAWCIWTLLFYIFMKFVVFKSKKTNIYNLLTNIIIFILVSAVLWFTRQLFIGLFFVLTSNGNIAMTIGGIINELLCLFLMLKVVFRKK